MLPWTTEDQWNMLLLTCVSLLSHFTPDSDYVLHYLLLHPLAHNRTQTQRLANNGRHRLLLLPLPICWWIRLGFRLYKLLLCYLSMVVGDNKSTTTTKCRWIAGNFDCHAETAVRRKAHRPMEHNPGFNRSHWMQPSGECSDRDAAAGGSHDRQFWSKTQNTNNNYC